MARYILIDSNTGYVWGDSADFAGGRAMSDPIEAARTLDESLGVHGRTYEELDRNPRTTQTGYDVYRADIAGSDAVPAVHDGQDRETIEAVERDCEYVGFVACHEG